jgi:hypothetical protein
MNFVFASNTSEQKKDYYAFLKPDPPVSFLRLLLHLFYLFTS